MDFERAEHLLDRLADVVDLPPYDDSERLILGRTLAITSLHFAAAVRRLCEVRLALGAATNLRSQFEAVVRGVWICHHASDRQIEKLSAELSLTSQQAAKSMPQVSAMFTDLERSPHLANLLVSLREFKDSSWMPLNSFVHAGIHAVHWTKFEPPEELLEQMFRSSNGLAVLAYQSIAILTGVPMLQKDVIAVCASYSSCLPAYRDED